MRVLHLIDSGGMYGAERMLLSLVQEQVKMGLEPLIVSASNKTDEKAIEAEAKWLKLPFISWKISSGFSLSDINSLIIWARKNKFDLIHSHGYRFNISLLFIPSIYRKIPVASTVHGYTATRILTKIWWYRLIDMLALTFANHVVVVSKNLQKRFFWKKNVSFIPNGISKESEIKGSDENVHVEECRYLAAIGRLSPEKGFDLLINAWAMLKPKSAYPKLYIAGDGPERENLEEKVRSENLIDSVVFLGYVDDVTSLIENADALIIPSRSEGLPIVLLEAMRARTPVISTKVGEIPSVLEHGKLGFLCEKNAVDLAQAISRFVSDEESAREITESAYDAFCTKYTASIMAGEYNIIYERVLGRC
jgi:glycosyltransferase involved in cell wall biosynthesis